MNAAPPPAVWELDPVPKVIDAVRAVSDLPGLLLLESASIRPPRGRYSFLMAKPIESTRLTVPEFGIDPFSPLREWSQRYHASVVPELPPFQGGAAGLMGYELGRCWERIHPVRCADWDLPVLSAGWYPWVIAWDHFAEKAWIIAHGWPETVPERRKRQAAKQLSEVRARLAAGNSVAPANHWTSQPGNLPEWAQLVAPGIWSDFSRESYLQAVNRVIEYIFAGDIFQANLTQRLLCQSSLSPVELYARLCAVNPAPFAGLYLGDDWAIISASPERFLHVADRIVSTRPIKGTRRRSSQAEADLFTRDSLRQSEKDRAENVMIVDLLRNDLSRVCRPGTVHVPQLCDVETYATVQHLVSEIRGELEPERDVWDLFAATVPGGSITGAPKVRAMEIIAELEPTPRGPYTGSLFYVGHDGCCDSNLLIRTFVARSGWVQCGVGGGIVAQSDPLSEHEETWHKAAGMLRALGLNLP